MMTGCGARTHGARSAWTATLGACLLATGSARGIDSYDMFYNAYYDQTTALPPGVPYAHACNVRIIKDVASEYVSAVVMLPGGAVQPLPPVSPLVSILFGTPQVTLPPVLAAFPPGTYRYSVAGGSLGSMSAFLTCPAQTAFTDDVPAFTPGTFDALQGALPCQDLALEFNSFTPGAGTNVDATFVTIFDPGNAVVFNEVLSSQDTTATVPKHTLAPGVAYTAVLYFSSRIETPAAGFDQAPAIVGFDRVTRVAFTTGGSCGADVDDGTGSGQCDGGVTIDDLLYYLQIFDAGDPSSDVDDGTGTGTHDGGVTIDDLLYYLFLFDLGC